MIAEIHLKDAGIEQPPKWPDAEKATTSITSHKFHFFVVDTKENDRYTESEPLGVALLKSIKKQER